MLRNFILFLLVTTNSFVFAPGVPAHIKELLEELNGSHLRFSATVIPYFFAITEESNGTFTYKGYHKELSDFLAQLFNITYSFVNTHREEEHRLGIKEGTVSLLMRDEVDLVTYTMVLNLDHCTRMDCAIPVAMFFYGLMVPFPEEDTRLSASIKPFQPLVWMMLGIVSCAITYALVCIPRLYFKLIPVRQKPDKETTNGIRENIWPILSSLLNYRNISNSAIEIVNLLTNHGNPTRYQQLSYRILLAGWVLAACVLVNAYSSCLFSFLVSPTLQPVTKSLDELASGYPQRLKLLTEKSMYLADDIFLPAQSGALKKLGDSFRENPETMFTNRIKGAELMDTSRYAYIAAQPLLHGWMYEFNKKAGYCRFTVSSLNLPFTTPYNVITFRKNWRYTEAFKYKMHIGWESGLYLYWVISNMPKYDKCLIENYQDSSPKVKKLSFSNLSSPFLILLLGLSLSLLVFLCELVWYRFKTHRRILNGSPKSNEKVALEEKNEKVMETEDFHSESSITELV